MAITQRGNRYQGRVGTGPGSRALFPSRELAEAWENAARACLREGLPIPDPKTITTGCTVGGFFPQAADYLYSEAASYKNNCGHMRQAVAQFGADRSITSIDNKSVIDWVIKLRDAGRRPATINAKIGVLFAILTHARTMGLIPALPDRPHQKNQNGRVYFLSDEEEGRLLRALQHRGFELEYHATRFMIYTGCRVGEILRRARYRQNTVGVPIEWRDVSSPWGTADSMIVDGISKPVVTFWETKDGLFRTIPLPPQAAEALDYSRSLGLDSPFSGLNYTAYYRRFQMAREDLGEQDNDNFVPHILRHTTASRFAQSGRDAKRIKEWLGHKNIQTTQKYMHLAPTDLFDMVETPAEPAGPSLRVINGGTR